MVSSLNIEVVLVAALIAAVAGVLGCFVVWRKMAYFGDSLSHSAMLGMALGVATGISENIGIIIICVIFSVLLIWIQEKKLLANDTILGIFAHAGLSIGMVAMALLEHESEHSHEHEHEILFGNLLNISGNEALVIGAVALAIATALYFIWGKLLMATISEDIARAEGINTFMVQLVLVGLVAFTVASSVEIVGIFLITALMIIPAATARQLASSPKQMALVSGVAGIVSVIFGVFYSQHLSIPTGPSIVVTATVLLIAAMMMGNLLKKN